MPDFSCVGEYAPDISSYITDAEGTLYVRRTKDGRSTVVVGKGANEGKEGTTVWVREPKYIRTGAVITITA